MKKIVGIIAAVAMAASVFAMDAAGQLKMNASLFDMTFTDDAKPTAIKLDAPSGRKPWGNTGIDINIAGDQAGGSINIGAGNQGMVAYQLWMQPIDMLKITLGGVGTSINTETIGWTSINGVGGEGFQFDLTPADGLSLALVLNPGYGTPWINNNLTDDNGKPKNTIGSTAFYGKYSADFGSIGAAFIFTRKSLADYMKTLGEGDYIKALEDAAKETEWDAKEFAKVPTAAAKAAKAELDFLNLAQYGAITLSAGYGNTFGDVTMFADVALDITTDSDVKDAIDTSLIDLIVDGFVKYSQDALSIAGYVKYTNLLCVAHAIKDVPSEFKPKFGAYNDLFLKARLDYKLDACGIYLYAEVKDLLLDGDNDADNLNMTIQPGVSFNVGSVGCDVSVKFENIGQNKDKGNPAIKMSVPFSAAISF